MWLLNGKTIRLEVFLGDKPPAYAILSQTWDKDEVTIQDIQGPPPQHKAGYQKIRWTCHQALANGLSHVWVDTCCIDKSNNTELSEAINSMFRWYRNSAECYVYFADVRLLSNMGDQASAL